MSTIITITVDRTILPKSSSLPDWVDILYQRLNKIGPDSYSIENLRSTLWLHDDQKDGKKTTGVVIYNHLKAENLMNMVLSIRDAEEIMELGVEVWRRFFYGMSLPLWKSVAQHRCGRLEVPFAQEYHERVLIGWASLDDPHFSHRDPTFFYPDPAL